MPKTTSQKSSPPRFKLSADYFFTGVSAWLIPGAGHWLLGYRVRGAVLLVSILGLFWVGEALAVPAEGPWKPRAVSHKVSSIFFCCQVGNGFCTLVADSLWGMPDIQQAQLDKLDRTLPRYLNLGILFASVSGLLNFLLVIHILDPRTWVQAALDRAGVKSQPGSEGGDQARSPPT